MDLLFVVYVILAVLTGMLVVWTILHYLDSHKHTYEIIDKHEKFGLSSGTVYVTYYTSRCTICGKIKIDRIVAA